MTGLAAPVVAGRRFTVIHAGFPMLRHLMALFVIALLALPGIASAQDVRPPENAANVDTPRASTGGAQTLQDVLRRQQGLEVEDSFRRNNIGGDAGTAPGLGPLGGTSDAEQWRALRYNEADVRVSTLNPTGKVLVQDGGMWWLDVRRGPLLTYGGWLLLGTLAVLAVFSCCAGACGSRTACRGAPSRGSRRLNALPTGCWRGRSSCWG